MKSIINYINESKDSEFEDKYGGKCFIGFYNSHANDMNDDNANLIYPHLINQIKKMKNEQIVYCDHRYDGTIYWLVVNTNDCEKIIEKYDLTKLDLILTVDKTIKINGRIKLDKYNDKYESFSENANDDIILSKDGSLDGDYGSLEKISNKELVNIINDDYREHF